MERSGLFDEAGLSPSTACQDAFKSPLQLQYPEILNPDLDPHLRHGHNTDRPE